MHEAMEPPSMFGGKNYWRKWNILLIFKIWWYRIKRFAAYQPGGEICSTVFQVRLIQLHVLLFPPPLYWLRAVRARSRNSRGPCRCTVFCAVLVVWLWMWADNFEEHQKCVTRCCRALGTWTRHHQLIIKMELNEPVNFLFQVSEFQIVEVLHLK